MTLYDIRIIRVDQIKSENHEQNPVGAQLPVHIEWSIVCCQSRHSFSIEGCDQNNTVPKMLMVKIFP